MGVQYAYSTQQDNKAAVEEIKQQLDNEDRQLIVFFCSSDYDSDLARILHDELQPRQSIGCTTAGELVSGQMLEHSVVAMSFDSESMDNLTAEVVENISGHDNLESVKSTFEEHFGESMGSMGFDNYIGMVLTDGLSGSEERFMERLSDATDVLFVGGSAGDNLNFEQTRVFHNGNAYTDAAVLLLSEIKKGAQVAKTQSFRDTNKRLLATEVDEATRTVHKFNDRPAAEAFAEAVGVSKEDVANHFMHYTIGLMADGKPYIRSPQRLNGDSMVFYCGIKENAEYVVFEATDVVSETKKVLSETESLLGEMEAVINFNCILRTLQLKNEGKQEEYGQVFESTPTIGFSTYGEQYIGHINQTATMLCFKK